MSDTPEPLPAIEVDGARRYPALDRWRGGSSGPMTTAHLTQLLKALPPERLDEVLREVGAARSDTKRAPGCQCTWEEGDSPCPVHPSHDDYEEPK